MFGGVVRAPGEHIYWAAEEALRRLRHLATEASGQVRAVSHRLHPRSGNGSPLAQPFGSLLIPVVYKTDSVRNRNWGLPEALPHEVK